MHSLSFTHLLLLFTQDNNSFIASYKKILSNNNFDKSDEDLKKVECAVLTLLRRRDAEDQLCCNDESRMIVKYVDVNGFVTVVTCTNCETDQETTCHNVNWTYEKIYDTSLLKKGDHICCHRPYAIWHHGIVTNVEGEKQIVHYSGNSTVVEGTMQDFTTSRCCNCFGKEFNSLYRVNYMDCYNSEYTVLRARSLRGEKRYNLFDRNCEHFSRWCKTGSTSSSQISIAWSSLGKLVLTIGLKAIGLLIVLGLIQYSHESQEEMVTLVGVGGTGAGYRESREYTSHSLHCCNDFCVCDLLTEDIFLTSRYSHT